LKAAIQAAPAEAGIAMANWSWKVVRTFVEQHFGHVLSRSSCLNYLHRLGFVLKRPKKRLLKADAEKRKAFVATYATLLSEAQTTGAKIFFADEAHFRADVDLRSKWVLRGEPALADTSSPRRGDKASYYSAVCLETGELEVMAVSKNCSAETSVAFLQQLRQNHTQPLIVIWDNAPAHRGDPMRLYLGTPDLRLKLVALPAYSPDFNPDEAIWRWTREHVTANTCLGTVAKVREALDTFFTVLAEHKTEIQQRCRTTLQAQAEALLASISQRTGPSTHVDFTLDSV
jgi:transposase